MKPLPNSSLALFFIALGCDFVRTSAHAELKTFTIDPTQSSLSLAGTFIGITLQEQGTGSLSTRFGGTIAADVTGSTITFVGGSSIVASNSGTWKPNVGGTDGSAPANYGGQGSVPPFLSGKAAFRNALLDVKSGTVPVSSGSFSAEGLTFEFPASATSALDYAYSGLTSGSGSVALAGKSTNHIVSVASVNTVGAETVLTIPINVTNYATAVNPNDVKYILTGQVVAKATAAVPLAIGTFTISPGQLSFTITTVSNQSYTILGSPNLKDFTNVFDHFTATNSPTTRMITLPPDPQQYFIIRQD